MAAVLRLLPRVAGASVLRMAIKTQKTAMAVQICRRGMSGGPTLSEHEKEAKILNVLRCFDQIDASKV